ncbi:MAG: ATP-binding cassette domain-containing protein [Candidatus Riflebacteria bacterium]|nr:ATP-binding cassette domain-containing protein [Candidatus Riflebacteria bacterium]
MLIPDGDSGVQTCSAPAVLEVEDLQYTYPDGRSGLLGVSFRIVQGEKMALAGGNGAGKSTLLAHLNGVRQGRGRIRVEGVELGPGTLAHVRSRVGLVFQDPDDQLFCPTVWEDVAFGPSNQGLAAAQVESRVRSALECVDLAGYQDRSPFHLSLGEKKRVALATVLACEPSVLALDEPTAELDPKHRRALIRWLQACSRTLLVASHDLEMVLEVCDRCLILEAGRLRADGPTRVLLGDAALMEETGLEVPVSLRG